MKALFFVLLLSVFICTIPASAHLEAGEDVASGGYLVDFGYDPADIVAGRSVDIAFNLVDQKTETMVTPEVVRVRISRGDTVAFAGRFHPDAGQVLFTYTFPEGGDWVIDTQFFDDGRAALADASFHVSVAPGKTSGSWTDEPIILFVEFGLLFTAFWYFRKKYLSRPPASGTS